jgi:hypothetical protein
MSEPKKDDVEDCGDQYMHFEIENMIFDALDS